MALNQNGYVYGPHTFFQNGQFIETRHAFLNLHNSKRNHFQLTDLSKQSCSSKPIRELFFPFYAANENICPVRALQAYEEKMLSYKEKTPSQPYFCPGLANITQCPAIQLQDGCKCAFSKQALTPTPFKAHSVRFAAGSSATWSGVTIMDILNAAY